MATQKQSSSRGSKNEMVTCDYCGEVYSSTYRTCPFCDESNRNSRKSGDSAPKEGGSSTTPRGRRVAKTTRGGGYGKPAYLNQIIFLVVTLVLIIAACWIVGKTIGPLLNRGDSTDDPSIGTTVDPDDGGDTNPDVTAPDITVPDEPDEPEVVQPSINSIKLSHEDVTLPSGESFTLKPTISPADADVTITWSTDSNAASVSLSGVVTNVNSGSSSVAVTITATVGDKTAECIVRCKPGSGATTPTAPTNPTTPDPDTSTSTQKTGTVTGAASGLNIRSGAGTSFEVIASLTNGSTVTVLDSSTSGWYKISFTDAAGKSATGFVSSTYVTLK